jgi:DNA-binding MarR family transcriptional regulator
MLWISQASRMAFDQRTSLGYLTTRTGRVLTQELRRRLAPLGIAPAQFSVLVELSLHDGLTQRELLRRLDVEQGTMTSTLRRMVRDGLVCRTAHEHDGRAARWSLTARAHRLLPAAQRAAHEVNRSLLELVDEDTRVGVLDGLRQLLQRHEEDKPAARRPGAGGR